MIHTVGLGSGIDEALLRRIAAGTGGRYFSAPSADDLVAAFEEIGEVIRDDGTDTDGDGLTDCEEENGLLSTWGMFDEHLDPTLNDPFVGDRVVTSTMEHNAVTRPLRALQERGVTVVKVPADRQGFVDPADIRRACAEPTRLVVLSHCSNVTGTLQPIEEIGPWCRRQGIIFLVDAAQSAGQFHLDAAAMGIDLLAAPGHKGLMGPPGTGLLYVREGVELRPLIYGGTGGNSHSDLPPEEMPERLEAGTLNTPGLAGVKAGIEFLLREGVSAVRDREAELLTRLIAGLREIPEAELYGPLDPRFHGALLSFNLKGRDPAEVGFLLDRDQDVLCRTGLHCAPDAHRTIGTFPRRTVRLSPGCFTTAAQIDHLLAAVAAVASRPPA